jgi:hypothetical protein
MPSRPRNYQTRRMPQEQAQTPTPTPAPTPAIVPPVTNTGGVMGPQAPVQGVRGDQDLFNRLFGKLQEGGGYVADQTIANTMQNRNILPAPISYTGGGLSPNIQRRADLMSASNPSGVLGGQGAGGVTGVAPPRGAQGDMAYQSPTRRRFSGRSRLHHTGVAPARGSNPIDGRLNNPSGPAMARDNGQAIARNTPTAPADLSNQVQNLLNKPQGQGNAPNLAGGSSPMRPSPTGGKMPKAPSTPAQQQQGGGNSFGGEYGGGTNEFWGRGIVPSKYWQDGDKYFTQQQGGDAREIQADHYNKFRDMWGGEVSNPGPAGNMWNPNTKSYGGALPQVSGRSKMPQGGQ